MAEQRTAFLEGPNPYCGSSCLLVEGHFVACAATLPPVATLPFPPQSFLEAAWREALSRRDTVPAAMLHVALVLQAESSVRPPFAARILGHSGPDLAVMLGCEHPEVGRAAWQVAVESFPILTRGDMAELQRCLGRFLGVVAAHAPDQLTRALLRAAEARGMPWYRLGRNHGMVQVGQGVRGRRLHETMLDTTSGHAVRLSRNKSAMHQLLRRLGFPVPKQHEAGGLDDALHAAVQIGYPVVVKPCHGGKGRGVSVGVATTEGLRVAYAEASQGGDSVLVESVVAGDDHRLLVVDGRLVAAALRRPAQVVGDGVASIEALVVRLNRDPRRSRGYQTLMEIVDLDREAVEVLAAQGLHAGAGLPAGRVALLRRTANVSRGGDAVDVTDDIHPDNARVAVEAARVLGLDVAGVDFMTPDISRSWRDVGGAILEVNANPGLRPHWIGSNRDVVGPVLERLIPRGDARIPTVGITGSLGKTTTARMVAHILAAAGKRVALATTQGTEVGGHRLNEGDFAGGVAAVNLLLHPGVEAGVFELARGGLIKRGMVLDRVDVGAVLNVLDNHLGLDGVTRREELAAVKQLVVSNATECAVLNADDPLCLAMRGQLRSRRVCLVGRDADSAVMVSHSRSGGETVVLRDAPRSAVIVAAVGERELGHIEVSRIPATLGGIAMAKAENACFALAIALGLGVPFDVAAEALEQFEPTVDANPGRLNLIRDWPFDVLLDWADGPVALAAFAETCRRLPASGQRMLLLTAAGNRPDEFIRTSGHSVARGFDRFFCFNHADLRGRQSGEVPALLREGLLAGGVPEPAIQLAETLEHAMKLALPALASGDLLAVTHFGRPGTVLDCILQLMATDQGGS